MKNYNESDYIKNKKNKAAIIYSHNGCTEILTYEKVSESENGISEDEFLKFKSLSDKMFHEIHKGDDIESKHISATYNDEIIDDLTAIV